MGHVGSRKQVDALSCTRGDRDDNAMWCDTKRTGDGMRCDAIVCWLVGDGDKRVGKQNAMQCDTSSNKSQRNTNSLGFESINSLELSLNIISDRLELAQNLLSLVDNILVTEKLVVVGEINLGVLLLELSELTLSIVGTLTESRDLSEGLLTKTQVGDLGEIDCSSTSGHCVKDAKVVVDDGGWRVEAIIEMRDGDDDEDDKIELRSRIKQLLDCLSVCLTVSGSHRAFQFSLNWG